MHCKIFNDELTFHGATTVIIEHLKRKHPIDSESKFEPKSKQFKMNSFASNKKCSKERSDRINNLIIKTIVCDIHPLNIVYGKGFRK